jgi:hypothetical protein
VTSLTTTTSPTSSSPQGAAAGPRPVGAGPPRRARVLALAAAAFSLAYGLAGWWWAAGGGGYPFANPQAASLGSLVGNPPAGVAGVVIALAGVSGAVCAPAMTRLWSPSSRGVLLGFGWAAAVTLTLLVPDAQMLMFLGYLPLLLARYGFGTVGASVVNQVVCVAGGLVWAAATLAFQRWSGGGCARCGRRHDDAAAAAGEAGRMPWWGVWATWVAVAAPLPYAATRVAWALGVPLGLPADAIGIQDPARLSALGLAAAAVAGSVLTMGLVQRWGEVFPLWMVGLAGRPVPPMLAVVPAAVVTVALLTGSRMLVGAADQLLRFGAQGWGPGIPLLALPIWGAALGVATLAYYLRRRGRCRVCARGA